MNQKTMLGVIGLGAVLILAGGAFLLQDKVKDQSLVYNADPLETNGQQTDLFGQGFEGSARQVTYTEGMKFEDYAQDGPTVLFFKAGWCPTCGIAQKDLDQNLSDLPSNVTIVTVDYDTYTDLKTKYGVTYQHTFVQIDTEANLVAIWNGGGVQEIAENIVLE